MANKKDPPKKKYKDINKYLPDFSSAASTTSTNKSPILSSAKIKQDVKKLENDEAAKKLLKSNPALGFKGKVPQQGKVDYPATDSRSSNYIGNPNMAFVRAGKTGAAGKMAEDNFNIETLGAMLPLSSRAGRVGKAAIETSKKSGLLSNAHKLNPLAFKSNPEMGYRMLGKEGFEDAIQTGVLRAKPIPKGSSTDGISLARNTNRNPNTGKMQGALDRPYFADGFVDQRYAGDYMAAVNKTKNNLVPIATHKGIAPAQAGNIPIENAQFYKKDWLQGYKEVPKPTTNFKSEINWSKWNKEIPENTQLMDEYKAIEQQAKANGSWMKYSDGSKFKGTPEQFVQMNHKNTIDFAGGDLKLSEQMYKEDLHRGSRQHIADFANRDLNDRTATFLTDSKKNAETYAGSDGLEKTYHHPDVNVHSGYDPTNKSLPLNYEDGIYQLGFPQNSKKVIAEANGNNWRFLDYNKKIDPDKFRAELNRSNFEHNLNDKIQHRFDYPEDFNINKDYLSTDDYATYIKNNNNPEGIVQINNVKDQMGRAEGIPSNTVYAVDANKVPIKSLRYNNGMFDITNPNIYKAVVPAAIGGTGLIQQAQGSNLEQYGKGGPVDPPNGGWEGDADKKQLMHTDGIRYSFNELKSKGYTPETIIRNWNLNTKPVIPTMAKAKEGFEKRPVAQVVDETPKTRGEAFKQARAKGDKVFTYQGKQYLTDLAPDKPVQLSASSSPAASVKKNITKPTVAVETKPYESPYEKPYKNMSSQQLKDHIKKSWTRSEPYSEDFFGRHTASFLKTDEAVNMGFKDPKKRFWYDDENGKPEEMHGFLQGENYVLEKNGHKPKAVTHLEFNKSVKENKKATQVEKVFGSSQYMSEENLRKAAGQLDSIYSVSPAFKPMTVWDEVKREAKNFKWVPGRIKTSNYTEEEDYVAPRPTTNTKSQTVTFGKGGPKPKSSLNSKDFRNLSQKYKDDYFNGGNEDSISDKIMSEGYDEGAAITYARYMQSKGPTSGSLFDGPSAYYERDKYAQRWPTSFGASLPEHMEKTYSLPSLGMKRVGNDLRPSSENPNILTEYATGGLINNNNNNMIKEFNGDLHSNPSEGIKYGNILVEDGELEHNGYIFSKDANETKEAKKQMNKRSLRTDENGYVWDGISRQSLDSKMKDLAKRHEEARLSEEYDNMVQNQIGMLPDFGGTAGGRMKYSTGGFNDMPVNTPQMITNQQPVNNFGGGLNASSNFKPDARFSPGFKPSSDPSIANPQRYRGLTIGGNISGGKKEGSGMSSGEAAGYAAAAGNLASTLGELGSDDPYAKVGLGEKDQGTQIAESSTDTVVSAIPFVGQWYGAGKGLSSGAEAVRDEARAQGEDEAAQAWAYMGGTIDPMGSWFDLKSDLDKGVEGTTGAAIANVFLPGLGDAIMEPNRRKWAEQQKKKQENKLFLDNRDYGGTEMAAVTARDRQTAGKGGPRMMYENGGEKPKLSSLDLNFLTGQSRQENAKPPYVYDSYSGTPNVFDMNQNLPVMMQPIAQNVNAQVNTPVNTPAPVNAPVNQNQTNGVQNNYVPLSYGDYADKVDPTKSDKKKVDWGNIAETAGMGLLSNVGNLAYLLGEGKDYDKVNYGVYNPDMVNASKEKLDIRNSINTALEYLKNSGQLTRASASMLATQGARQLADAEERVRLANIGILNDAKAKNMEYNRLSTDATAQNKGVSDTNWYAALSGIGENMQNAYGNYNLRNADAERVAQNKIKNDWISRQMELTFGKNS